MYTPQIKTLQIDLISACNARCPACFRQDFAGQPQNHFPKNLHLDLDRYEEALRDPALKDLQEIFLTGNYGDPMASPRILEMLDRTDRVNPALGFFMHTNGGLGTKPVWQELGRRLNGRGRFVKFAIDGLADTNAIYRRGVSWNKVMENAQIFIAAGGRAVWKYVVFQHNQHQIEEAREMAQAMGFVRFETVKNYSPQIEPLFAEKESARTNPVPVAEETDEPDYNLEDIDSEQNEIVCDAKKEQSIFMDFEGHVWPCCWMAGWKYAASKTQRTYHQMHFEKISEDKNFNSLLTHSVSNIIGHNWFAKDLENSWQNSPHKICHLKCGKPSCGN